MSVPLSMPAGLQQAKYISLATFRKSGAVVRTPVWFAPEDDRLYIMTRSDSGKYKRIRNNSQVLVAACTIRGKITGPEFSGSARILPAEQWPHARGLITAKYWLARVPFLWSKLNVYVEVSLIRTGAT
jgi:PPOX class probable F420-dependent enzyme